MTGRAPSACESFAIIRVSTKCWRNRCDRSNYQALTDTTQPAKPNHFERTPAEKMFVRTFRTNVLGARRPWLRFLRVSNNLQPGSKETGEHEDHPHRQPPRRAAGHRQT